MKKRLVSWLLAAAVSAMQLLPSVTMIAYADNESGTVIKTEKASPVSEEAEETTEKYEITDVIESVSIGTDGTVGTVLKPTIKYKTGFNKDSLVNIQYAWSNGTDLSDSMVETYEITEDDADNDRELRVIIGAGNCSGLIASNTVIAGKGECNKPILQATVERTEDGFTIEAMEGYEYIISNTADVPTSEDRWDDLENGDTVYKEPGSVWYVFTRVKETDETNASEPSAPVIVKIKSDDSTLKELLLSNEAFNLNPDFAPDITDYEVIVPYGSKIPTVTAVKNDDNAEVTIKQAMDFDDNNQAVITVVSENGISEKVYTVTLIESAVLTSLTVNDELIDGFSPTKLNYTYSVPYAEWKEDEYKTYEIAAESKNDLSTSIYPNSFILENDDPDTASEMEVAIDLISANGDEVNYTIKFIVEACPHTNRDEDIVEAPTCEDAGRKEIICLVCGKPFDEVSIPALGHDYNGEVTFEATCTDTGIERYECSRGDDWFERTIPALGHRWGDLTVETEATCTDDGISVRYCEACGASGYRTLIQAVGHNFGAWTKADIANDNVAYERICSVCKTKEEIDYVFPSDHVSNVPSIPHVFDGRVEINEPATCKTGGSQNVYCSVEGCGICITEATAPIAHTPAEAEVVNPATCTEAGESITKCADCNEVLLEAEIPAKGHSFTNYTDTATCTAPGIRTAVCDNDNCDETDMIPTPAKEHSYGELLKDERGHWKKCSVCGSETNVISHSENDGIITTQPTETKDGIKTYSCTECGYVIRTEAVKPVPSHTAHTFGTAWITNDTSHWHKCTVCGEDSAKEQHVSNGGVVTVKPTSTTEGTKTYSCSVCNYVIKTETIAKTDDNTGTSNPVNPTPSNPTPSNPTPPSPTPSNPIPPIPTSPIPTPSNPTITITPSSTISKEPYIYGDASKTGWEAIISEINFAADGGTVRVNVNGVTELPQAVVSCIQNRNINLEINMGNTVWTINGFDVTAPKTVNMRVAERSNIIPDSVMENLYSELAAKQLRLYHNGSFGFNAKLALNVGKKYNGYYAALYYYNTKTKQLEYSGQNYVSGGKAEFEFTHASYYAIGFSSEPIFDDVSSGAGVVDFGTLVDTDSPVTNGVRIPQAEIPRGFKLSNRKRRYRILKKRRLDDLVFVM
ncbi:MAG: cadherin-like beta sandwich domain-containing protein [Oscillospiraceae bacterium]|nr:cadherin-like beta sandwich domain-containing protein [Oscillospiraceae bacterium]